MAVIEPQPEGEVTESGDAQAGAATDTTEPGALIMAEVADPALDDALSEREDAIGERRAMGPPIDWDAAPEDLGRSRSADAPGDDVPEETPVPLADGE